jgi:hypothetical protein
VKNPSRGYYTAQEQIYGMYDYRNNFMKLEVPYGSDESIQLSEDIARLMLNKAVRYCHFQIRM